MERENPKEMSFILQRDRYINAKLIFRNTISKKIRISNQNIINSKHLIYKSPANHFLT